MDASLSQSIAAWIFAKTGQQPTDDEIKAKRVEYLDQLTPVEVPSVEEVKQAPSSKGNGKQTIVSRVFGQASAGQKDAKADDGDGSQSGS